MPEYLIPIGAGKKAGVIEARAWFSGRTNGVYGNDDFTIRIVDGMEIEISPGRSWLQTSRFEGSMHFLTEPLRYTLNIGDPVYNRIDRVVIRYDRVIEDAHITIVQGTPANNPVGAPISRMYTPPDITPHPDMQPSSTAHELLLYDIHVDKGATVLQSGKIIDKRLDEAYCGYTREGMDRIPTDALQAQFLLRLAEWDGWAIDTQSTWNEWWNITAPMEMWGIPRGGIIMWGGWPVDVPFGWAICDGTNGTPDLRDRFVVGSGGKYAVGDTGGAESVTLSAAEMPSHLHGVSLSGGTHSHTSLATGAGGSGAFYNAGPGGSANNVSTSLATVSLSGNTGYTGSGAAHENRPPYYALCYIMRL